MAKDQDKPRGVRSENPGNIVYDPANKWQGQIGIETRGVQIPSSVTPRFAVFKDPIYGIRAIAVLLIKYQDQDKLETIQDLIFKYAPTIENNSNAYAQAVAKHMGLTPSSKVFLHEYGYMRPMIEAIIEHENGVKWNKYYTSAQLDKALVLAGVEPPKKPIIATKAAQGGAVATVAATVQQANQNDIIQPILDQIQPFAGLHEYINYACFGLTLLGVGWMVYGRLQQRKRGIA